eukprot:6703074-Pyramimonas_sp.AAC.1
MPVPRLLVAARAGRLLSRGLLEHAVTPLLALNAYLRPGELDALTRARLVAPGPGTGVGQQHRAPLLGPSEPGAPTSVGAFRRGRGAGRSR